MRGKRKDVQMAELWAEMKVPLKAEPRVEQKGNPTAAGLGCRKVELKVKMWVDQWETLPVEQKAMQMVAMLESDWVDYWVSR